MELAGSCCWRRSHADVSQNFRKIGPSLHAHVSRPVSVTTAQIPSYQVRISCTRRTFLPFHVRPSRLSAPRRQSLTGFSGAANQFVAIGLISLEEIQNTSLVSDEWGVLLVSSRILLRSFPIFQMHRSHCNQALLETGTMTPPSQRGRRMPRWPLTAEKGRSPRHGRRWGKRENGRA